MKKELQGLDVNELGLLNNRVGNNIYPTTIRFSDTVNLPTSQAKCHLKRPANNYLNIYPCPDDAAKNPHTGIQTRRKFLRERPLSDHDLDNILTNRLTSFTELSSRIQTKQPVLGIAYQDCPGW